MKSGRRQLSSPLGLALLLPACLSTSGPEILHHDLRPAPPAAGSVRIPLRLRVEPFFVRGGRDRLEFMVRSGDGMRLGRRTYHRWVRRPSEMVDSALLQGLRARRAFLEVEPSGLEPGPDLVLTGELSAFEQVYESAAWSGASEVLVELTAELSSRRPALQPEVRRFTSRGRRKVGVRDLEGDRADVAVAAQAALEQAVAALSQQVVAEALRFQQAAPDPGASGPVLLDLQLAPPPSGSPLLGQRDPAPSLRVHRLRVAGGLNRYELLTRVARHRLELRADLRWQRRPGEVVLDGVVELLRAADLEVLRPSQPGRADLRLDGYLRKFELDLTGEAAGAVVELELSVDAVTSLARGRAPVTGDSADELAAAFESAIASALAAVPALVQEAAAAPGQRNSRSQELPAHRFLVVEPRLPGAFPEGLPASVRVLRLELRPDLDRTELMLKDDGAYLEIHEEFLWQRRPAQRVTDALEAALRSAQGSRQKVGGALSPGEFDFELGGRITAYQLRRRGRSLSAEVSVALELSAVADGQADNPHADPRARQIVASASAPIAALEPGAISAGMGQALSTLLEDLSMQVLKQVQDRAGDE